MKQIKGIYDHFACHTRVPVPIDEVRGYVSDLKFVDEIDIYALSSLRPEVLRGLLQVFNEDGRTVARVVYSSCLSRKMRRIVCCKELLHILDQNDDMASSRQEVQRHIENLNLSALADLPASVRSDQNGSLHALMILFPRDYLHEIRRRYEAGKVTAEEISDRVQLPLTYVRAALSKVWQEFLETYI